MGGSGIALTRPIGDQRRRTTRIISTCPGLICQRHHPAMHPSIISSDSIHCQCHLPASEASMCWRPAQPPQACPVPAGQPSCHRPRPDQRTRTVAADEPRGLPIKALPHRTDRGEEWARGRRPCRGGGGGGARPCHCSSPLSDCAGRAQQHRRAASRAWNGHLQTPLDWPDSTGVVGEQ